MRCNRAPDSAVLRFHDREGDRPWRDPRGGEGRLIVGLEQLTGFGVTTNQTFLMSCLRHPGFAKGEATTAFIGAHRDELLAPRADAAFDMALAGLLLYVTNPRHRRGAADGASRQRSRCRRKSRSQATRLS